MNSKNLLLVALLCGGTDMIGAEDGFIMIDNGKALIDIVIPAKSNEIEKYAAEEMQKHLGKAGKCQIDIVTEDQKIKNFNIYIGSTKEAVKNKLDIKSLPKNSYKIRITEKSVILTGLDGAGTPPMDDTTSQGTLFAVYNYLNENIGVRWFWPGEQGTLIPKKDLIFSGIISDKTHVPRLIHSRMRDATDLGPWKPVFSESEYLKAKLERQIWLRRHQFACGTSFDYGHAFVKYWERFKNSNPEFFAMLPNGKRVPFDNNRTDLVQMCISNKNLQKQIIEDWLNKKKSFIGAFINGIENDRTLSDTSCICENCKKMDPKGIIYDTDALLPDSNGVRPNDPELIPNNMADRYAKFWITLQNLGKKYDVNATVIGYAYFNYSDPPTEIKLNKNIIVGIVPNRDYPLEEESRSIFRTQWLGWNQTGAALYLRPNYYLAGYSLPYIFAKQFGDDYKFFLENGLLATDFDSLTAMFATQGPNLYMLARLNDNPSMSVECVLDDYYSAFGKASSAVKKYFDNWESLTSARNKDFIKKHPGGGWNSIGISGNKLYTMRDIEKSEEILKEAIAFIENDSESLDRVKFLQKGLQHAKLTILTMNAFDDYKTDIHNTELQHKFNNALKELDDYRYTIRNDQVVNIPILLKLEIWMGWRSSKIYDSVKGN